MRTVRLTIIGLAALLAAAVSPAYGQERNMSRMVRSYDSYLKVGMGVHGEGGDYSEKDIFMPESTISGRLDAVSQRLVDNVRLYGHFGYSYEYGRRSTWRGWIDPYSTPFMLTDSIPGDISIERYSMQAGVAVPLSEQWSLGLDAGYEVGLMAKHKDLRNKNTAMDFHIAPGVYWQGAHAGLGLDLGYGRSTEQVEYMQMSQNVENVLFSIYGVWVAQGFGFSSSETKRLKEDNIWYGDFQADLEFGGVGIHNQFGAAWKQEVQTETGYNNLRHGDVRSWRWTDDMVINIGDSHIIEASIVWSTMQGFREIQRQELDPDSRIRMWVTYGDPVYCYFRRFDHEVIRYSYAPSWKIAVGADNLRISHAYSEYPHRFDQSVSALVSHVETEIPIGKSWKVAALLGYTYCYHSDYDITEWQLATPLTRQCQFWTGNSVLGRASAAWNRGRLTLGLEYGVEAATAFDGARHTMSLNAEFSF
ncbi:MAG: hypothetical protein K6G79_03805 [Bacteroidales bacterium]|nr:hypothetical protein [Bacteroidales bacterium]